MTFSSSVKNEILSNKFEQSCCKIAALSAFIRGAGTISQKGGNIGFEFTTESESALSYFKEIIESLYGVKTYCSISGAAGGRKKYLCGLISDKSFSILEELGIISYVDGEISVNLSIDRYLTENDCCKRAYIIGAFIGSGSITVPKTESLSRTNYHFEIVFSKYQTASDFSEILSVCGFMPKLTERKDSFIVYFKNCEEISDLLAFMGASKSCLKINEIAVERNVKNETNRKVNCEIGNLSKQVDASVSQIRAINLIKETIGLETLSVALKETALLRTENPDMTLAEMADKAGLSKSCLNHRLRKLMEIAKNLD